MLQQTTALFQPSLQHIPFLSGNDPGHAIELPGPQLTRIVLVRIEGDAIFMQQVLRFFRASSQHVGPELDNIIQHALPVSARLLVVAQQLVMSVMPWIVPENGIDCGVQIGEVLHGAVPGSG